MGESTKTVTFADFSGGEWGEIGEFRAAANQYTGSNVVLYANGMLGPRAGLHENTYLGTMVGQLRGLWSIGKIGKPVMINVDDKIYDTTEDNFGLGTVVNVATLDEVPTDYIRACWYDPNGEIYLTSPEKRTYALDWTTNALTEITVRNGGAETAGVQTVYLCRDRLYAAGDAYPNAFGDPGAGGQYVYYSAAANFTDFSGGGFFQVGYFNSIRSLMESQNSLLFSALESTNNLGNSTGWYSLVGAVPQGDLRRVNTQIAAEGQSEVVNAENGNIYFWTGWTTGEDDPYLCSANGAKFDEESWKHLRLAGENRFGYYNSRDKTLIYTSDEGDTGYMRCNGAWSKVDFGVNISGPVCPTERGDSFLVGYGETGQNVKIYELLSRPERPGRPGGSEMPGDDSDIPLYAHFSLPAYQSEFKDIRVRRVIVDFQKWDTDHDGDNRFTTTLRTWGQYNLPGGTTDGAGTVSEMWNEDQALSSADGTLDRYVFRTGTQGWSSAFQISITGLQGVAIESVTVEFDEAPTPDGRPI